MALGRYQQVISSFKQTLKLDKDYQDAWYNLASIYALRRNKAEAIKYLKQAIILNPRKYIRLAKNDANFTEICQDRRFKDLMVNKLENI